MRSPPALLAVLLLGVSLPGAAHTVLAESTVGRQYAGLQLLGDLELRPLETYLSLSYGVARQGGDSPLVSHQLGVGADQTFGSHWLVSGLLTATPPSGADEAFGERFRFRSSASNVSLTAGAAYDSAGFSALEYGFDLSATATRHALGVALEGPARTFAVNDVLGTVRPSAGVLLIVGYDTEVSARAAYTFYGQDPLAAGRLSDEQIAQLERRFADRLVKSQLGAREGRVALQQLSGRLLQADARTGLQTAPVSLTLRAGVAHRLSSTFRLQLNYLFDRYVPTQGHAHVVSTRLTVRQSEKLRFFAAVAVQRDVPEGLPAATSGLGTLGIEVGFGG